MISTKIYAKLMKKSKKVKFIYKMYGKKEFKSVYYFCLKISPTVTKRDEPMHHEFNECHFKLLQMSL